MDMSKRSIHFFYLLYFLSKKALDSTPIKKQDAYYYITAYKILIALQVRKSEVC